MAVSVLTKISLRPDDEKRTTYLAGIDPDSYREALPFLVKATEEAGGKPEDEVRIIAAKVVGALRDRYGFTPERLDATQPYLLQFLKDFRSGVVQLGEHDESAPEVVTLVEERSNESEALSAELILTEQLSETEDLAAPAAGADAANIEPPASAAAETAPELEAAPAPAVANDTAISEAEPVAVETVEPPPEAEMQIAAAEAVEAQPEVDTQILTGPVAEPPSEPESQAAGDGEAVEEVAFARLDAMPPVIHPDDQVGEAEPISKARKAPGAPKPDSKAKAPAPDREVVENISPAAPAGVTATSGPPSQMLIVAVCSQKGGAGKTTIAAHMAVQAGLAGHGPAVLIDTDPQGSLGEWWRARKSDAPALARVKLEDLVHNLAELRGYGTNIAVIDTPPALTASIQQVIEVADLILIPARPSPHDLRAVGATVEMARRAGKPFLFVVNGAAPRASITAQAVAALSEHGRVVPVILYQRTDFAASMIDGRTVMESAPSGRSAQEIADMWQYVYEQISMRVAA